MYKSLHVGLRYKPSDSVGDLSASGEDSVSIKSDAMAETLSIGSYQSETSSLDYGIALYSYQVMHMYSITFGINTVQNFR